MEKLAFLFSAPIQKLWSVIWMLWSK